MLKFFLIPKEDSVNEKIPRLHIIIGRRCIARCIKLNCPLKNRSPSKLMTNITNWLYKINLACVYSDVSNLSGTKYCFYELKTVEECTNCLWFRGFDSDLDGICASEDYRNQTTEEFIEDLENGLDGRCRYWEPGTYKPYRDGEIL